MEFSRGPPTSYMSDRSYGVHCSGQPEIRHIGRALGRRPAGVHHNSLGLGSWRCTLGALFECDCHRELSQIQASSLNSLKSSIESELAKIFNSTNSSGHLSKSALRWPIPPWSTGAQVNEATDTKHILPKDTNTLVPAGSQTHGLVILSPALFHYTLHHTRSRPKNRQNKWQNLLRHGLPHTGSCG